MMKQNPGV